MNIGLKLINSAAVSMLLLGCSDKGEDSGVQEDAKVTLTQSGVWYGTGNLDLNIAGNSQYTLTVTEQTSVEINLTSEEDAYLVLLDNNYNLVNQNNDASSETTDSKLIETLDAGTYTIIVSANWLNTIGEFELSATSNENHISGLVLDYASSYTGDLNFEGTVLALNESESAKVCLDLNSNFKCDDDLFVMTENSEYAFDQKLLLDYSSDYLGALTVLAQVTNSDDMEFLLVSGSLKNANISPMSTLLNAHSTIYPNQTELNSKLSIITPLNLTENNTELFNKNELLSADEKKYYAIEQVVAGEIKEGYLSASQFNSEVDQLNIDKKDESLHLLIASTIIKKLTEISDEVDAKTNTNTAGELINVESIISDIDSSYSENELTTQVAQQNAFLLNSITINVFGDYGSYFDDYIDDINTKNNVSINYEAYDWGGHHNRLSINLATGSGAGDVEFIDTGMVGGFLHSGALLDLTAEFETYRSEMVDYAVAQGQNDLGQQVAIPIDLGPGVAFYRRDYMEDLGFDVTQVMTSWDSWLNYGRTLRDEYGVYLVSNAGGITRAIIYGTIESGNGVYVGANGENLIESERFKFAFNMAKTLREEGLDLNSGMWNDNWYDGFRDGTFAMEIQGAWMLGHIEGWIAPDTSGLWGVSNLPAGIYGTWGGTFAAIPSQSADKKDAAWRAIEYMISPAAQLAGFENWAMFPANKTVYSDAVFNEEIDFLRGQKARELFADIANNVTPILPSKYDSIAETLVVNTALQEVLADGRDIDAALKDAADQLTKRMQ